MRWDDSRRSSNIEDRRGMRRGGGTLGIGTVVVGLVATNLFGVDPRVVIRLLDGAYTQMPAQEGKHGTPQDEQAQFIAAVLGETEDVWGAIFQGAGEGYTAPTLVLFSDQVSSACGRASAAVGPFYCPGDSKVYIDLAFY